MTKRTRYDLRGKWTPWGPTQDATEFAPGIVFHSTAGHGGFHLDRDAMRRFRKAIPDFHTFAGGSWFEEDCDACAVVLVFPEVFDSVAVENCENQVRNWTASDYFAPVARWLKAKEARHAATYR